MEFIADNLRQRDPFYSRANLKFDTTNIETAAETEVTAAALEAEIRRFLGM